MKLIMKYIAVLCSRWFDRRISHLWFCQPWVIVHVAEWGKPSPSIWLLLTNIFSTFNLKRATAAFADLFLFCNYDYREIFFCLVDTMIAVCLIIHYWVIGGIRFLSEVISGRLITLIEQNLSHCGQIKLYYLLHLVGFCIYSNKWFSFFSFPIML